MLWFAREGVRREAQGGGGGQARNAPDAAVDDLGHQEGAILEGSVEGLGLCCDARGEEPLVVLRGERTESGLGVGDRELDGVDVGARRGRRSKPRHGSKCVEGEDEQESDLVMMRRAKSKPAPPPPLPFHPAEAPRNIARRT